MPSVAASALPPPLFEGDRLDSAEFLRRWEAMPDLFQAELIDGVVFMASPVGLPHSTIHFDMNTWLGVYKSRTPGCEAGSDATWVMGPKDVPQPDIFLRILPAAGGQSGESGQYAAGAPELIVEVSGLSRSRDLGVKLEPYRRAGVREYLTVLVHPRKVVWRQLTRGRYREIQPDREGILRSQVFPGLWLDPASIWDGAILEVLERGLQSPGHAVFVKRSGAAAKRRK